MKRPNRMIFLLAMAVSVCMAHAGNLPFGEWNFSTYEGAFATFVDGSVSVAQGGSEFWHVQLSRRNISLESGKTYELKFQVRRISGARQFNVRIGRDGFPYDAFAEFGEISASDAGKIVSKTFVMGNTDVNNARLEFNLGKSAKTIVLSDVSLECLDCANSTRENFDDRLLPKNLVVAGNVNVRDGAMLLGNVLAKDFELGADAKVYGNVGVRDRCQLRERAFIQDSLHHENPCEEQNRVFAAVREKVPVVVGDLPAVTVSAGHELVAVGVGEELTLRPGSYGEFFADARSKVRFAPGKYSFRNFRTELDVQLHFDLNEGPASINVLGNVRFGDRNRFQIDGGNPSEISWNVTGDRVDFGTDGLYFGKVLAPNAAVRIPSRSHLVGGVYASALSVEPQSTVSMEPRAREISHSEEHFGPFFDPETFRYRSQVSPSTDSVEMFVFADKGNVKVDGKNGRVVKLESDQNIEVSLLQEKISGFPEESFHSIYRFRFEKKVQYKIYFHPQTSCTKFCDGSSPERALGKFSEVLELAQTTGREIQMLSGYWKINEDFQTDEILWKVGFEIVGNTTEWLNLSSANDLPQMDLSGKAHLKIEGKSPRSLRGFRILNGLNENAGGALSSNSQQLCLKNMDFSSSLSKKQGGALYTTGSLTLENVRFVQNRAVKSGGALLSEGNANILNVLFIKNESSENGGAAAFEGDSAYLGNTIFYANVSKQLGGAIYNHSSLDLWNSTFFRNQANANGAIGGIGNGSIGNCIFWENFDKDEILETEELILGFSAKNSSFSKSYLGTDNFAGDPKFYNEKDPEGPSDFLDYRSGINLSNDSPILQLGKATERSPSQDILGADRETEQILPGAYAWPFLAEEASIGALDTDGRVKLVYPIIPLINEFPGEWLRGYLGNSNLARVMKATVRKHRKTRVESAEIEVTIRNQNGETYEDIPSVRLKVYRNGEENGKYVFQSKTLNKGKPILFSQNPADVGNYDDAIILCIKESTDYFHIRVIDY